MRFYLDVPLVVGYVLMATTACLGMLQLSAARGGYVGLSLFTTDQKRGVRIGVGLTVGAVLAYMFFAPEILTPGPAGTELAEIFILCALIALGITLAGADLRLRRARARNTNAPEAIVLSNLAATLYPHPPSSAGATGQNRLPVVVLLPDPTGFVVAPLALVEALRQAGMAVLVLDALGAAKGDAPLSRRTLLGNLSIALFELARQPGIDAERIGLVGLGLGGDAALRIAAADSTLKAVASVSPWKALGQTARPTGLQWLRELSYRNVWRLRRRWGAIQEAVADLDAAGSTLEAVAVPSFVLQPDDDTVTTRIGNGGDSHTPNQYHRLAAPGARHFTLLEKESARKLIVQWFAEKLDAS